MGGCNSAWAIAAQKDQGQFHSLHVEIKPGCSPSPSMHLDGCHSTLPTPVGHLNQCWAGPCSPPLLHIRIKDAVPCPPSASRLDPGCRTPYVFKLGPFHPMPPLSQCIQIRVTSPHMPRLEISLPPHVQIGLLCPPPATCPDWEWALSIPTPTPLWPNRAPSTPCARSVLWLDLALPVAPQSWAPLI